MLQQLHNGAYCPWVHPGELRHEIYFMNVTDSEFQHAPLILQGISVLQYVLSSECCFNYYLIYLIIIIYYLII